jgi:hypothetical protein
MTTRAPANRKSWKTEERSVAMIRVPYHDTFSDDEMTQIRLGIVPRSMDEKWFIFFEQPFLFFHRSWTGRLIYRLEMDADATSTRVKDARVVDDPELYRRQSDEYEVNLISFLIRRMLLHENVPFPVPEAMRDQAPGAYQHHVVGLGAPESIAAERRDPTKM